MGRLFCNCQLMGFLQIPLAAVKHGVLHQPLSSWSQTIDPVQYDKIPLVIAQLYLTILHTPTQKSWSLFKDSSDYMPFLPAQDISVSVQFSF